MYFILHVSYVSRGENFLYLKKTCIIKTATQKMYCMNANRQHEEDIQTKGRNGQMLHQQDATGHSSTSPSAPAGPAGGRGGAGTVQPRAPSHSSYEDDWGRRR